MFGMMNVNDELTDKSIERSNYCFLIYSMTL